MVPTGNISLFFKLVRRLMMRRLTDHEFWQFYARMQPTVAGMRSFKDIGKKRRCFIMGGGPSLRLCDPSMLCNEVTFGVNGVFLIEDWLGFLPTYYVVEDNLVVEDRKEQIGKMKGPHKFYSKAYRNVITDEGTRTLLNVIYDYSSYPGFPEFGPNASKSLWVGGTVTYLCLQIAYYMGFEKVYLIGMDHSYKKPEDVLVNGNEWTSRSDDPNHFHPDYFGKGKRWHDPRPDRMELAYKRAKQFYEADEREILNATVGGKLEVFDRVNYDDLFNPKGH